MVLVQTLAFVAAAFVLALGIVLLVPVRVRLEVDADCATRVRSAVTIVGLFGLVVWRRDRAATASRVSSPRTRPRRAKGRAAWWRVRRGFKVEGFAVRARAAVREILERLRPRELEIECAFGLEDPADTGALYGALQGVLSMPLLAAAPANWRVTCAPDFSGPCCRGRLRATVQASPAQLTWPLVRLLVSGPGLRAVAAMARRRSPRLR